MSTKKETEEGVILVPNPQVLQQIDAQRQIAEVNHLLREQEMQRLRRMTPMQQPQMIPSMEAIRRLAFDLQKTLIPGAEDVELIGQMISLIEETATYLYLVAYKQKQTPQLPCFYGSSFYYLYKLAIKRGQRPIYLYHLAEIAKLRVQETLPGIGDKIVFPSLKEVVEHFQRFEKGGGPELTSKKQLAESLYEKVLGEAYNYIQKHHAILMAAPKSVNFLIRVRQKSYSN
uniref:CYCLIN domain-containing protein n=1 Tax=Caenorhabditis tropicalis TaxID=1561998 RepID=A0A1I7TT20_9PELO